MDDLLIIEPAAWDDELEREWSRQMAGVGTASPLTRISSDPPKGKILWLTVRRALLMTIRAFDAHYGIGKK